MKIVTYDEVDPEEAMLIHRLAFGYPVTPNRVKLIRRLDRHCTDYFGAYALNDEGRAVSQVQVLHIDTRTREGREKVAGIAGMATLPEYSRQGFATALMRRVHELTLEQGIRISMLLTSPYMVAYEMYEKLGYQTLVTFLSGHKKLEKSSLPGPELQLRKFTIEDTSKLDELFALQIRDNLGFVLRQEGFIRMKIETQQISPENLKVATRGGKTVGYVRSDDVADCVKIYDFVGVDDSTRSVMLDKVEGGSRANWAFCYPAFDSTVYQLYEDHGYKMQRVGWGRVMATSIDASLSGDEITSLYEADENRFVMHPMDMF